MTTQLFIVPPNDSYKKDLFTTWQQECQFCKHIAADEKDNTGFCRLIIAMAKKFKAHNENREGQLVGDFAS